MPKVKKKILFNKDARQALIRGVSVLAKAVTTTLGPRGRNVGLGRKWNAPKVVHDGVSVAKEVEVDDPFEQMGVDMVREAAEKTNTQAGDGTTTSILLAEQIALAGDKEVETHGANPMAIQRGLQTAGEIVSKKLLEMTSSIDSSEQITQVATVSSADPEVGKKIAEAVERVGKKGVIYVEEGKGLDTSIEYKEGMEFDRGYASPYFVTDNEREETEVSNPYIFMTAERIVTNKQIMPILNAIGNIEKSDGFNVVIIADKVDYEALGTLFVNHSKGVLGAIPIEAPGFGDKREEILEDIAVLTGGQVFSPKKGMSFDQIDPSIFGRADKVWSGKSSSKIIGGKGDTEVISLRVKQLENQLSKETSEFEREKIEERIARLVGSVAIINVGAATETELHDRKERMVDAVAATKAAVAEGILPGGGIALLRAREELKKTTVENPEEQIGINILYEVLGRPVERLLELANIKDSKTALKEIMSSKDPNYGCNVSTGEMGDLIKLGIIDPTKVIRTALQNAISVAGIVITTEVLIAVTDIVEGGES
jgi:chaperonin GroEL